MPLQHFLVWVRDAKLDTRTLTLAELERVEETSGTPWHAIDPVARTGDLSALVGVLADRHLDPVAAVELLASVTLADLAVDHATFTG